MMLLGEDMIICWKQWLKVQIKLATEEVLKGLRNVSLLEHQKTNYENSLYQNFTRVGR